MEQNNNETGAYFPAPWLEEQSKILEQQQRTIRLLVAMVVTLFAMGGLMLLMPSQDGLSVQQQRKSVQQATPLSELQKDLNALQRRIMVLLNQSIQGKIKNLESRLADGHFSGQELLLVQELRQELHTLEEAYALLEQAGYRPASAQGMSVVPAYEETLANDLGFMKNIFVVSMASLTVVVTMLGGYLYSSVQRLRQVEAKLERMIFLSDLSS